MPANVQPDAHTVPDVNHTQAATPRLREVRVLHIGATGSPWAAMTLDGQGEALALAALNQLFNSTWLTLDSPYLHELAQLQGPQDGVSLREDGWVVREGGDASDGSDTGDWVRVAASHGEADALVRWADWQQALRLLRCFLTLQQRYPSGEVSYSAAQGFRVRLRAGLTAR